MVSTIKQRDGCSCSELQTTFFVSKAQARRKRRRFATDNKYAWHGFWKLVHMTTHCSLLVPRSEDRPSHLSHKPSGTCRILVLFLGRDCRRSFPTYEPFFGPSPNQPGDQTNKLVRESCICTNSPLPGAITWRSEPIADGIACDSQGLANPLGISTNTPT